MENVRIPVPCWCPCGETTEVSINTWTGAYEIVTKAVKPDMKARWAVVFRYKELKGISKENFPGWEGAHLARHLKVAGKILAAFRGLPDPLAVALEAMDDCAKRAAAGGWPWTLETIDKTSERFLLEKQKGDGRR